MHDTKSELDCHMGKSPWSLVSRSSHSFRTDFKDTQGNLLFTLKNKTLSMRGSLEASKPDGSLAFAVQGHFKSKSFVRPSMVIVPC